MENLAFNTLKSFEVLSACTEEELIWLAGKLDHKSYFKGDSIYREGQEGNFVYFVTEGSVKLGITSSSGKILIKDIVQSGNIFGENIFTSVNNRKEFAEVMKTKVSVYALRKSDFQKLLQHNDAFAQQVINLVVSRLTALERRMQNFVFKKAKARIVDFLVTTGRAKGIRIGLDELLINHGMSHKEIAYLTDTSRQTVARVLGELKKDRLIHFSSRKPSKILIRNMDRLRAF